MKYKVTSRQPLQRQETPPQPKPQEQVKKPSKAKKKAVKD